MEYTAWTIIETVRSEWQLALLALAGIIAFLNLGISL